MDGEVFDVYCDMETDQGGWTLVAKSFNGLCSSLTEKDPATPVSDLDEGYALWLVPEALAQSVTEILFAVPGPDPYTDEVFKYAVATLDDTGRAFLSVSYASSGGIYGESVGTLSMPIVRNGGSSGYVRSCGYNTLDMAGYGYAFDFADGYPWHGTGFGLCLSDTNFYDSPLANPNLASYSCENFSTYYMPDHMFMAIW